MPKQLLQIIWSCRDCPFCRYRDEAIYCDRANQFRRVANDGTPSWCPLPNVTP